MPGAGKNLQAQYERWQPRAKYKTHLDPTMDDVKKLAVSCRRSAKVRLLLPLTIPTIETIKHFIYVGSPLDTMGNNPCRWFMTSPSIQRTSPFANSNA